MFNISQFSSTPTATAALLVQGNAPVADCEAEGCNRPRIVDGLAEQYCAAANEHPADDLAPGAAAAREVGAVARRPVQAD